MTSSKAIRVLLVDDDPAVLVTLGRSLGIRADIEVVGEAADGEEAVALAKRISADVIVMDERMPRMTGLEATKRIRQAGIDTPVLMFTADDTVAADVDDIGNVRFLSKGRGGIREVPQAIRAVAGRGVAVRSRGPGRPPAPGRPRREGRDGS